MTLLEFFKCMFPSMGLLHVLELGPTLIVLLLVLRICKGYQTSHSWWSVVAALL